MALEPIRSFDRAETACTVEGSCGPWLVVLRGWGCNGEFLWLKTPHFAALQRILAPDLLGHGASAGAYARFADLEHPFPQELAPTLPTPCKLTSKLPPSPK